MTTTKKKFIKDWKHYLDTAFFKKFGIRCQTDFSLFAGFSGEYVTSRQDRKKLTREQRTFIEAYSNAWQEATT